MTETGEGGWPVLRRLRVADLSTLLAAPQVGAVLADLGADVVKVEPPQGDPLRNLGTRRHGVSLPYLMVNRRKRRVEVDYASSEGLAELYRLLELVDVVVLNQPRGVLESWGCSPEQLLERDPGLVVVTVSCYGWSGPLGGQAGNGSLAEAFGGLTNLTGVPDGPPVLPSVPLGDSLVGMAGALAAIAGCWGRDAGALREAEGRSSATGRAGAGAATGRAPAGGRHVDVSMYEPVIALLGTALGGWEPGTPPPERTGSRVAGGAPRNVYRAGDGRYLVVSATTDGQARRALEAIGAGAEIERFASGAQRAAQADEIDELVARWIEQRDRDEAITALGGAGVPVAPLHDLSELVGHPQVQARGSVARLSDPVAGTVLAPGPVAHFSEWSSPPPKPPAETVAAQTVIDEWQVVDADGSRSGSPA